MEAHEHFSAHFGEKYPWHDMILEKSIQRLRSLSKEMDQEDRIELRNGLNRLLREIYEVRILVNALLENFIHKF